MTQRYLSATNGFVPMATGQIITYVRSVEKFAINSWAQMIKTDRMVGLYAKVNKDQPIRIVSANDNVWADGADRPSGQHNQGTFEWVEFQTQRYDFPFTIGDLALKQAKDSWEPLKYHTEMVASQAMTQRTWFGVTALETASNWDTGHVADANTLNGGAGTWDQATDDEGSPHYLAIWKSLNEALIRINMDTGGVVNQEDLVLMVSPNAAIKMAQSAEINNYLKYGPYAMDRMVGTGRSNSKWSLPPEYKGFKIVVEDAVRATERANAAQTSSARSYIKSDNSAVLMSRKGGIDGNFGSPSFSTFQIYFYDNLLEVYTYNDVKHARTEGHVVENYVCKIPAPASGCLITNILS
jgi:hypothetical protein